MKIGGEKMKKRVLLLMIVALILTSLPVFAAEAPVVYKDTFTVTSAGGNFHVGFVNIQFKKNFLDQELLPATFDVQIYAENGKGYIEFTPSTPVFNKKVHIWVHEYDGLLYDRALGKNIHVHIKKQLILASHFSRYAFRW